MRVEHDGSLPRRGVVRRRARRPGVGRQLPRPPRGRPAGRAGLATYDVRELPDGPERAEWWQRAVEIWSTYGEYQKKTDRLIPVFLLELAERGRPVGGRRGGAPGVSHRPGRARADRCRPSGLVGRVPVAAAPERRCLTVRLVRRVAMPQPRKGGSGTSECHHGPTARPPPRARPALAAIDVAKRAEVPQPGDLGVDELRPTPATDHDDLVAVEPAGGVEGDVVVLGRRAGWASRSRRSRTPPARRWCRRRRPSRGAPARPSRPEGDGQQVDQPVQRASPARRSAPRPPRGRGPGCRRRGSG